MPVAMEYSTTSKALSDEPECGKRLNEEGEMQYAFSLDLVSI